ncbi:MAG: AzlD domain-containing protein [Undibacterium sp.]|uniref:AzlD domain-containing protein n=1 Tax=Undibacterium sp. TaxID=1914977 RepID=UPI0027187F75|nr:AzlD domain-containing protein [Undibacterium sp.]MDO8654135.1 AzlD domain-containing protein [Undibacterium sp.]
MNITLTIIGMAVITVFIKAVIFILGDRVAFSTLLKKALSFVPVTVLTAIITPMILSPHGQGMELNWHNPQLIASLAAVIVCLTTRRQLPTIILGLLVFFGWQFLLK